MGKIVACRFAPGGPGARPRHPSGDEITVNPPPSCGDEAESKRESAGLEPTDLLVIPATVHEIAIEAPAKWPENEAKWDAARRKLASVAGNYGVTEKCELPEPTL